MGFAWSGARARSWQPILGLPPLTAGKLCRMRCDRPKGPAILAEGWDLVDLGVWALPPLRMDGAVACMMEFRGERTSLGVAPPVPAKRVDLTESG